MNGVYFNGRYVTHPGAYSTITSEATTAVDDSNQRVVALVGESQGGTPNEVLFFDDPEAAKRVLRGGELLKGCQKAWSPTNNGEGANLIAVIRSNQATQSKLELNDGIPVASKIGNVTQRVSAVTTGDVQPSGIYSGLKDDQLVVNVTSLGVTEIPEGLAASIGNVNPTVNADTTGSLSMSGQYAGSENDQLEIRVASAGATTVAAADSIRDSELSNTRQNVGTTTTGNATFGGNYDGDRDDTLQLRIVSPNGTVVNSPINFKPSDIGSTSPVSVNPSTTGNAVIGGVYRGNKASDFFQIRIASPTSVNVNDPANVHAAEVTGVTPNVDAATTGAAGFDGSMYNKAVDNTLTVRMADDTTINAGSINTLDIEFKYAGAPTFSQTTIATDGTDFVEIVDGIRVKFGAGDYTGGDEWDVAVSAAVNASSLSIAYKYATQNASAEQIAVVTIDGNPIELVDGLNVSFDSGLYHPNDMFQAQVEAEIKATNLQLSYKWLSDGVIHNLTVPVDGSAITLNNGIEVQFDAGVYNNNDAWEQDVVAAVKVSEIDIAWKLRDDTGNQSYTTVTVVCNGIPQTLVHGVKVVVNPGVYHTDDRFLINLFAAGQPVTSIVRYKYASQNDSQYRTKTIINNGNATEIVDGISITFTPGVYFQNDLFFVDVFTSRPYGDSATALSKDYGTWTRSIQIKQEAGSLRGTKKITVNQIGTDTYEVYDNIGATFTLKYDGVYTHASVEVLQDEDGRAYRLITRVGDTAASAKIDLDIDLTVSSFETTKQLIDYITSFAGYYGNVINGTDHRTPSEFLDRLSRTVISGYNSTQVGIVFTAYWYGISSVVNSNSRFLTLVKNSPTAIIPQNFTYATLIGGSDGVSPISWEKMFNKLSNYRITYVVALTSDRFIQEELKTHVLTMSNNHDKERFMMAGGRAGMPVSDCIDLAYSFNTDRVQLAYPGFYDYSAKGALELQPSYMTAAMLAGRACYKGVAESSTFDEFNVAALEFNLGSLDISDLLKAGVAPLETVIGDIGKSSKTRLVLDRTTWTTDDTSLHTERSVRLLADYLNQKMRKDIEAMAIGKKGVKRTLSSIKTRVISTLSDAVRKEEIVAFRNVIVKYKDKVLYIDYEAAPVDTINFALITGHFYTADEIVITDNGQSAQ